MRKWAETVLPEVARMGAAEAAKVLGTNVSTGRLFGATVKRLQRDAFDDIAGQTKFMRSDTKRLLRDIVKETTELHVSKGLSILEARKIVATRMEALGIRAFVDNAGRSWKPKTYATMAIRTRTALAYNTGTIVKAREEGVTRFEVFDGLSDELCASANGTIVNEEWARANPIAHPNCRRAFAPVPILEDGVAVEEPPASSGAPSVPVPEGTRVPTRHPSPSVPAGPRFPNAKWRQAKDHTGEHKPFQEQTRQVHTELEDILEMESGWDGTVSVSRDPKAAGHKAAACYISFNDRAVLNLTKRIEKYVKEGSLARDLDADTRLLVDAVIKHGSAEVSRVAQLHTTVHESLHAHSVGNFAPGALNGGGLGIEEGLVESFSRLLMRERIDLAKYGRAVPDDLLEGTFRISGYNELVNDMEVIRDAIGMEAFAFHRELLETPLADRSAWILSRINAVPNLASGATDPRVVQARLALIRLRSFK